jgi:hypothetical protein
MEQPMRKRLTFLVTVLEADEGDADLRGRLQVVNNGETRNFKNIDELDECIREFLKMTDSNLHLSQTKDASSVI